MRAIRKGIVLSIVIGAAAWSGCSVPDREFHAVDAAPGGDGAEPLALVLNTGHLDVTELGASKTFTVKLNHAPTTPVDVTISADKDTKVAIGNGSFEFTAGNFDQEQTVTVSASDDDDAADEAVKITVAATGGLAPQDVSVTVTDNDTLAFVVSAQNSQVTMDEGNGLDLRVHLSARPLADVIVTPMVANGTLLTTDQPTYTISAAAYDQDQTIHLFAPKDANAVQDDDVVTLKANDPLIADVPLTVHIQDLDQQGITVSPGTLQIVEDGTSGVLHVTLKQDPVVSTDVMVSPSGAVNVVPGKLTFTSQNYTQPQDVTVTTPSDNDTQNATGQVTLTMGSITRTVDVTVTDDDVQAIKIDQTGTLVLDENSTATFKVWLAYQPSGPVRIDVASTTGAATVTSFVDFDATDWNMHKVITVTGVHDSNLVDNPTTIRLTNANLTTVDVPASVHDVDTQAIVLDKQSLGTITEGGQTTFKVNLAYDPGGSTLVTLSSDNPGSVGVPASVAFGSNDYSTPKTVTVTALEDDDANPVDATITLANAAAPVQPKVTVHVNDNDTLGLELDQAGPLSITENTSTNVRVRLTAKPDQSVTVTANVPVGQPLGATPGQVSFAPAEWNTYKSISLGALDDANATAEAIDVGFTSSPNIGSKTIHVDTVDDDNQLIVVNPTSMSLTEPGSQTLSVSLKAKPAADTIVNVTTTPASGLISTGGTTQLTFTTSNYNVAQMITVSAPSDNDTAGGSGSVNLSAPSLSLTRSVPVDVTDDDHQQVMTDAVSPLQLGENGTTTFDVWLAFKPSSNMTVSLVSANPGTATAVGPGNSTSLTFTSSNYGTHQTVTVTGTDDQNLSKDNATIQLVESTIPQTISITAQVADDDTQQLLVAPTGTITVNEGSSKTFTVALKYDPGTSTNVSVVSSDTTALPVTPSGPNALTFTSQNYSSAKTVTINAPADSNTTGESAMITVSGGGAASVIVSAMVNDLTQIVTFGWPNYFSGTGTYSSDSLMAYSFTVSSPVTINKMKVIAGAAGGNARMAIYTDTGSDTPGNVVAGTQTAGFALQAYPTTSTTNVGDTLLAPGKYWLGVVFDSSVTIGKGSTGLGQTGRRCSVTMVYGGGFPSTFGTANCVTVPLMNLVTEGYQ